MTPVRVVVVEDSATQRALLVEAIEEGGAATVVAQARTSEEALGAVQRHAPEVVTMDLEIPGEGLRGPGAGGLAAIEQIMASAPTPILVLSAHVREGAAITMLALAAGAAEAAAKPPAWTPEQRAVLRRHLLTLRGVAVVGRRPARSPRRPAPPTPARPPGGDVPGPSPRRGPSSPSSPSSPAAAVRPFGRRRPIVGLAASTGGPLALAEVIAQLGGVPAPIVVVQHLHGDFSPGFVQWLGRTTGLSSHLLGGATAPLDGRVYVAPGGRHVRLDDNGELILSALPETLHRPSADELLHSLARHAGSGAVAAVLTGMGADGAEGLRAVADAGGACFAQDSDSCAVYGMPRAAVEAQAVAATTPLAAIGPAIVRAARRRVLQATGSAAG